MRSSIVQVEQQLRLVSSPAYAPQDRDKAIAEQNVSDSYIFLVGKVSFLPLCLSLSLSLCLSIYLSLSLPTCRLHRHEIV